MVKKQRSKSKLKTFYLDGKLLRTVKIDRANDLIYVWSFTDEKRQAYVLSDALRRMQNAFSLSEVARMMQRHKMRMYEYIGQDSIRKPQRAVNLSTGNPGKYYFSEDDVIEVWEHFASLHRGRPRNDGISIPKKMPSRTELMAMMRKDKASVFIQDDEGNYIPVWRERYVIGDQ